MWTGGVRVIVLDEDNRILMVKQEHPERTVWMVPGGGIEEGENSAQAAVREVREETGLEVEILGLIWHVEEVSERGQRFVNFFRAVLRGGKPALDFAVIISGTALIKFDIIAKNAGHIVVIIIICCFGTA